MAEASGQSAAEATVGPVEAWSPAADVASSVLTLADLAMSDLDALAANYGMRAIVLAPGAEIPGSYWGGAEAGLVGDILYVRPDTPGHSALHELCHYVCMNGARRARLATDAGGDDDEECGVCYLEILLADELRGFGRTRCLADMDAWGYNFREGSAGAWWRGDARFAREWLLQRGLIDSHGRPTLRLHI